MRPAVLLALTVMTVGIVPSVAFGQRVEFTRTLEVVGPDRIELVTDQGKIEVVTGPPGRVVVDGTVTVRVGWNVPSDAAAIARRVAGAPPIEQTGDAVTLRVPQDRDAQRAVIISYRVQVPPGTRVQSRSDSGETTVRGMSGAVDVRTQSATITVTDVAAPVQVFTGSGAVAVDNISGALTVNTQSSGITGTGLSSSVRIRTQSGAVDAEVTGSNDVDVETGSSSIRLRGVRGGLNLRTQSGRVAIAGAPGRTWTVSTGSSRVDLDIDPNADFVLDALSRSGSVVVEGNRTRGPATPRAATLTVGTGGPTARIRTGSGAIRVLFR